MRLPKLTQPEGWLRAVPLPMLSMAVGLLCGLLVWAVLDPLQTAAVDDIFRGELQTQLHHRAREALTRFEHYVSDYKAIASLLAHQHSMVDCLAARAWPEGGANPRVYLADQPSWLPATSFWTSLVRPSHVLVFDLSQSLREIYQLVPDAIPDELARDVSVYLSASEVESYLTTLDGNPYLLVAEPIQDAHGERVGALMLVVPIDSEFMRISQRGVLFPGAVLALVDADVQRILASSNPDSVAPATRLEDWRSRYMITAQSFFDYDGSDRNIQFATLIPESAVAEMSSRVLNLERRQRIIAAAVFIAVFTLAIFLVSAHLNAMLKRLSRFSQRALGFADPPISGRNQLVLLEDWISRFTRLVMEARDDMAQRHESELRETEALKTAVMEAARDCVITMEDDGRIIEFNSTAERTFGFRRQEVVGCDLAELLIVPASLEQFGALVSACSSAGVADAVEAGTELWVLRKDGTEFPVEAAVMPIRLRSRQVLTVYLHDVSKRRRVEKEIEGLAKFTSESPSPILRTNGKGVVLFANAAATPLLAYWGCGRGQTLPVFWRDRVSEALSRNRQEEREIVSDDRIYSLLLAPVVELDYVNIFGRDITEVRRAEQSARQHQAELVHVCRLSTMGEMSTGIAHELNQPLSAIVNFARGAIRRLKSEVMDETGLEHAFGQIALQAERAAEIIRRVRNLVARQPPVRSVVDLNALVREVCSFVEYDLRKLGIEIELRLTSARLRSRADLVQIEQVLLNLIRNAMDALQEVPADRRSLVVRTSVMRGGLVRILVHDSGPGIPRQAMSSLFDPFFTTKAAGMGMGLPISKTIVDDHKGSITVWSRPGRGTTFTVLLPTHLELSDADRMVGTG